MHLQHELSSHNILTSSNPSSLNRVVKDLTDLLPLPSPYPPPPFFPAIGQTFPGHRLAGQTTEFVSVKCQLQAMARYGTRLQLSIQTPS